MTKLKTTLMATAIALAGMAAITPATAIAGNSAHMTTGGITSQPIGHAYFCQQYPQECQVKSKRMAPPVLTKKRWAELVKANDYANQTVKPVTDMEYYGVEEHWTYPKGYGDCEDYALLKRYQLLQQGWPESSLLITVVKLPSGDGHAVLTVRTKQADFILDNLETKIERWDTTLYQYLKRQSTRHTGRWISIKDNREMVAGY